MPLSFFVVSLLFVSKIAIVGNSKFTKLSIGYFQRSLTGYQKISFYLFLINVLFKTEYSLEFHLLLWPYNFCFFSETVGINFVSYSILIQ